MFMWVRQPPDIIHSETQVSEMNQAASVLLLEY